MNKRLTSSLFGIVAIIIVGLIIKTVINPQDRNEILVHKIGVIGPFTGVAASYGEQMKKGIASYVSKNVEIVYEDDACEPAKAVSAFKKLTEVDKVHIIIGPLCGSPQESLAPITTKTIVLLPAAAPESLFEISDEHMYNLQYSLETEGTFIANEFNSKGYKNIAIISYNNSFSKHLTDSFRSSYKGTVIMDEKLNDETSNVKNSVLRLKQNASENKLDAIYAPDISFFFGGGLKEINQYSLKAPVYASYAIENEAFKSVTRGVLYPFPKTKANYVNQTLLERISAEATELAVQLSNACRSDNACVQNKLKADTSFKNGARISELEIKQVK